jgi:hypothetical protein
MNAVSGTSSTDVWAVGDVGGSPPYIMHWDGAAWTSTIPEEMNATLYDVEAITPTDAWAVGAVLGPNHQTLTMHWDGAAWTVVDSPSPGFISNDLLAVAAVASDDVWAAGLYGPPEGGTLPLFLHWDGTSWTRVPEAPGLLGGAIQALDVVSSTDIWAVGYRGLSDFGLELLTERWNGTEWEIVRTPNIGGDDSADLKSVAAASADDAWAVGTNYSIGPVSIHWTGVRWREVAVEGNGPLNGVGAIAGNDVWAVGGAYDGGLDEFVPVTQRWDGRRWTRLQTPSPGLGSGFTAIDVVAPDEIWAVGSQSAQLATYPLTMRSRGVCG